MRKEKPQPVPRLPLLELLPMVVWERRNLSCPKLPLLELLPMVVWERRNLSLSQVFHSSSYCPWQFEKGETSACPKTSTPRVTRGVEVLGQDWGFSFLKLPLGSRVELPKAVWERRNLSLSQDFHSSSYCPWQFEKGETSACPKSSTPRVTAHGSLRKEKPQPVSRLPLLELLPMVVWERRNLSLFKDFHSSSYCPW